MRVAVLLSIFAVAMMTVPAAAEVQSVKVSGEVNLYGLLVEDYDQISTSNDNTEYFATSALLQVDADLTDNVSAVIGLISERLWDVENSSTTDVDVNLAYVTVKEMLYSPMTLIAGRQPLRMGNGLLVGDPDTNACDAIVCLLDLSSRKSFDAIRASLDYDPYALDLFFAQMDEDTSSTTEYERDKILYGINFGMPIEAYDSSMEAYIMGVTDKTAGLKNRILVLGALGNMVPMDGMTLSGEIAYQTGDYQYSAGSTVRDREALALDVAIQYAVDNEYNPVLGAKYASRSGEKDATSTTATTDYEAWDEMFEDQTNGTVANYTMAGTNVGQTSNVQIIGVSGSIMPNEQLTLIAEYFHYILDQKYASTTLTTTTGSYTVKTTEDELGDELDITLIYDYTEDVQLGLQLGLFMPGDVFDSANKDDSMLFWTWMSVAF